MMRTRVYFYGFQRGKASAATFLTRKIHLPPRSCGSERRMSSNCRRYDRYSIRAIVMGVVCLHAGDGKKGGTTKQTRPFIEGGVFLFSTQQKKRRKSTCRK
jgi:hypothetical protein